MWVWLQASGTCSLDLLSNFFGARSSVKLSTCAATGYGRTSAIPKPRPRIERDRAVMPKKMHRIFVVARRSSQSAGFT